MKRLTVLLVALMLSLVMGQAAASLEVETSVNVTGSGVINCEVDMQSSNDDTGLKYHGEEYTPGLGLFGSSRVEMAREYYMVNDNESEMRVSEASKIGNAKSKRRFKNYDLGSLQGFDVFGDYMVQSEFGGDSNESEMMVEAKIDGRVLSEVTVRELNGTHSYVVRDKARYVGKFDVAMSSRIAKEEEPKAGDEDWLTCP